jgi:hypothetical protein
MSPGADPRDASLTGSAHPLNVGLIALVAGVAAIVGDDGGYWLGQHGGTRLVRRYGHWVRLDARKLKVGRYLFARHGGKVVFFGRLTGCENFRQARCRCWRGGGRWRLAGISVTGKAAGLPCRTHVVRSDRPLVARTAAAARVFPFTAR